MISFALENPLSWSNLTALWESFPRLQMTYIEASEPVPCFISSIAESITEIFSFKEDRGMLIELVSAVILKWWAGRTSTRTCGSQLSTRFLYSVMLIRSVSRSNCSPSFDYTLSYEVENENNHRTINIRNICGDENVYLIRNYSMIISFMRVLNNGMQKLG